MVFFSQTLESATLLSIFFPPNNAYQMPLLNLPWMFSNFDFVYYSLDSSNWFEIRLQPGNMRLQSGIVTVRRQSSLRSCLTTQQFIPFLLRLSSGREHFVSALYTLFRNLSNIKLLSRNLSNMMYAWELTISAHIFKFFKFLSQFYKRLWALQGFLNIILLMVFIIFIIF